MKLELFVVTSSRHSWLHSYKLSGYKREKLKNFMKVKNRGPRGEKLLNLVVSSEFLNAIHERKHRAPDLARVCGFVRKRRESYIVKSELILGRFNMLADAIEFPRDRMFEKPEAHNG